MLVRVKFNVITKTFRKVILATLNSNFFFQIHLKHIITKCDILLAVHNFNELKTLDNNAKIKIYAKRFTYFVYQSNMAYIQINFIVC